MNEDVRANERGDLLQRLSRALSEQMGFPVQVTTEQQHLVLTGQADSEAARAEAQATLQELSPHAKLVNRLTVNESRRPRQDGYADHDRRGDQQRPAGSESLELAEGSDLDPGFDDQPLETNAINVADDSVFDLDPPAEPDPVYFAPTDPVIGFNGQGGLEVLGGFAATSMSDVAVDRSTLDGQPGDEAIADAVRRELREDAETTSLALTVEVQDGIVHLSGRVADVSDAEDAEEIASRVPGVREVIDETQVAGF
jgi:osmotically-inducible protein OsmY